MLSIVMSIWFNIVFTYEATVVVGAISLLALITNICYDRLQEMNPDDEAIFDEDTVVRSIRKKEGPYRAHNTWHTDMTIPPEMDYPETTDSEPTMAAKMKKSDDWDEEEEDGSFNIWEDDEGI